MGLDDDWLCFPDLLTVWNLSDFDNYRDFISNLIINISNHHEWVGMDKKNKDERDKWVQQSVENNTICHQYITDKKQKKEKLKENSRVILDETDRQTDIQCLLNKMYWFGLLFILDSLYKKLNSWIKLNYSFCL